MNDKTNMKSLYHCVYKITYHLVLVTKYRNKVITQAIMRDLRDIFAQTAVSWGCTLIEFNGESDHVHLLIETHPNMRISNFVNNLKTVSSRLIRKQYKPRIDKF